jgi:hypothetical protein
MDIQYIPAKIPFLAAQIVMLPSVVTSKPAMKVTSKPANGPAART